MPKLTTNLDDPADVSLSIALLQRFAGADATGSAAAIPARPGAGGAPPPPAAPRPASPPAGAPPPPPGGGAPAMPPPAAPPPPPPAAGGTGGQADFAALVQKYADAYGPKATKARFAELSAAVNAQFNKVTDVPPEWYPTVIPWFTVAA